MHISTAAETTTTGVPTTTTNPMAEHSQRLLEIRIGEASHPGPRGKGKAEKSNSKTVSPKRPHSHLHTTTVAAPRSFFPSRKPRVPLAFPPPPCPVSCPSRLGKEAQTSTTKLGVKTHEDGQVPDQ